MSSDQQWTTYKQHFDRMGNTLPSHTINSPEIVEAFVKPWMEGLRKDAPILDLGCGYGHQLYALKELGFTKLSGIDFVEASLQIAKSELAGIAQLELGDAFDFLPRHRGEFQVITVYDVLEHIPRDRVVELLRLLWDALKPGGVLSVRVPNMASLGSAYSMYLDFTHVTGYTEFSMMQVMDLAGFVDHRMVSRLPKSLFSITHPVKTLRRMAARGVWKLNYLLHFCVYWLRWQRPMPSQVEFNLEMYTHKPKP